MALLGWAPKGEREIYSLEELKQEFDIEGLSKSPSIFDPLKLRAINGEYIRMLTPEKFLEYATPYIRESVKREDVDLSNISALLQNRTEVFTDIPEQVDFIDEMPNYDLALYENKKMKTNCDTALDALTRSLPVMEAIEDWRFDVLHDALFKLIADMGVKNGYVLWPVRVAISGKQFTPGGAFEIAEIIGKDDTIARMKRSIEMLKNRAN